MDDTPDRDGIGPGDRGGRGDWGDWGDRGDPVLDLDALAQLEADAGSKMLPDLLGSFVVEAEQRAERLAAAAAGRDAGALEHESHALKACAQTYGAEALHRRAAAVEQACLQGNGAAAAALARAMPELAAAAVAALESRFTVRR